MKLTDTLLLSAGIGFTLIGTLQLVYGLDSYWLFMLAVMCLLTYKLRKPAPNASESKNIVQKHQSKGKTSKKRKRKKR